MRRVYDAVARRDAAAVLDLYDPGVEVDGARLPELRLSGRTYPLHGHEGLRSIHREWNEAWATPRTVGEGADSTRGDVSVVRAVTRRAAWTRERRRGDTPRRASRTFRGAGRVVGTGSCRNGCRSPRIRGPVQE